MAADRQAPGVKRLVEPRGAFVFDMNWSAERKQSIDKFQQALGRI